MMHSRWARILGAFALLMILLTIGRCATTAGSDRALLPAGGRSAAEAQAGLPLGEPLNAVALGAGESGRTGLVTSRLLPPAGESQEGVYAITLAECLHAGRLTYQDQKIRLTRQEWYSSWAALDGRLEDATPVRIKGEDLGEIRVKVFFTVGTRKSDLNKARVRLLKEGFEAHLLLASPRDP